MPSTPSSSTTEMRQVHRNGAGQEEWVQSVPLPAVKGTIGGIESPWRGRGHAASPSLSNVRDFSPTPSRTALPSVQSPTPTPSKSTTPLALDQTEHKEPVLVANPDAPFFRPDPTVRTCLESLPFDTRDVIQSLFLS